jgi:hypothetical protein
MSDKEKSEIATSDVTTISNAFQGGLVTKEIATRELLQLSRTTGRFTNITEQDIEKAKEEDANQPPPGMTPEENPMEVPPAEGQNEGMDLTTKAPEAYQEQSIKSPLKGREESITAREQETQRDEIEETIVPSLKPLSEVVMPLSDISNLARSGAAGIKQNLLQKAGEGFKNIAQSISQKFFSKDVKIKDDYVPNSLVMENETQPYKGYDIHFYGGEIFVNYNGRRITKVNSIKEAKNKIDELLKPRDADFKESEHPRAKSGEFTKKGTNGGNTSESSIKKEIQQAPDNVKGMEKSRKEAQDRIKQWKESGMTDEEILYDGYRWREFVKRLPDSSWDWAVWEQIQQLAQEKGFEYKENLTEEDIFNDPKMPMDDLEREIPKANEETTNYRNNNNKNKIISYLKTPEGEKYTKISQRKIWGLVSSNEGKEIISHKSGLGATSHFESYSPFKGMENLLKAKSFEEALNTNITVYRGITDNYVTVKSNLTSYTTCPEIAKLFAEGYFHNYNSPGTGKVITREVKLKDIKGFINNDGEYEVLLNIPKKEQIVSDGIKNQEEDWLNFLHKFKNKQVGLNGNKE